MKRLAIFSLVFTVIQHNFLKFWRNTVIPIGMAEYCLKIGRIPPKSEWLAAMYNVDLKM